MKRLLLIGGLVLCVVLGNVSCSSDNSDVEPLVETGVDNGGKPGEGNVVNGELLGKWHIVKTIEFDKSNAVIKEVVKTNGECSTDTAYFLENDKVIFNSYARNGNTCEIMDEYDGRWKMENGKVLINEDWRDTAEQRKAKKFSVTKLTKEDLELSYDVVQGDLTNVKTSANTAKIVFVFAKVKR